MSDIQESFTVHEQYVADYVKDNYGFAITKSAALNILGLGRVARLERGEMPTSMLITQDDAIAGCEWVDQHKAREALEKMFGGGADTSNE